MKGWWSGKIESSWAQSIRWPNRMEVCNAMNPQDTFCPNWDCPARGQRGQGNIGIHSQKRRRYICHVCGKTFSERQGTAFYRLHSSVELVTLVITLLAYGCPLQA